MPAIKNLMIAFRSKEIYLRLHIDFIRLGFSCGSVIPMKLHSHFHQNDKWVKPRYLKSTMVFRISGSTV